MRQCSLAGGLPSLAGARCAPLQARARFKASRPCPTQLGAEAGLFLGGVPSGSSSRQQRAQLLIPRVAKRTGSQSTTLQQQEDEASQASVASSSSGQFEEQESSTPAPSAWGLPLPQLATKTQLVMACSLGFCLANMDKVNFTLAVIPMGLENDWTPTMIGLVQSAFFYGFLLMQIPGSILTTRLGGANVLPRGVSTWSFATASVPFFASNMPVLCGLRAITGLGEAIAPSSIVDIISRAVPPEERASSVSFAFSGLHVGSICGLLLSPAIISTLGWPSLFYLLGLAGISWSLWFLRLVQKLEQTDPEASLNLFPEGTRELSRSLIPLPMPKPGDADISGRSSGPVEGLSSSVQAVSGAVGGALTRKLTSAEAAPAEAAEAASTSAPAMQQQPQQQQQQQKGQQAIPYRAFLRSHPVRVLMFTHFAHNWFHYTWLAWLPTYLTSTLSVDLSSAARTALLPPIAGIAASAAAGVCGDGLLKMGLPTHVVRKLAQAVAFCLPTAFLTAAITLPNDEGGSMITVGCITAALGISSFSLAGLYCSHQDLSKRYASALLGLTNVAGSMPGIIGVTLVGYLYDTTDEWSVSLFMPSATLLLAGAAVYITQSKHDAVDFDSLDNSPFPPELWLKERTQGVQAWFGKLAADILPGKQGDRRE